MNLHLENLHPEESAYFAFHQKRYEFNLNVIQSLLAEHKSNAPLRILEFGPHILTKLIELNFGPQVEIHTIGYRYSRFMSSAQEKTHVDFDFNDLQFPEKRPQIGPFDLVIFCEVIEHLYTSPAIVLPFIKNVLAPGGHVLYSTPNAVSFSKRLQMLLGRNPYEKIREEREIMGHIREYTRKELLHYFGDAGFTVTKFYVNNYWPQNPLFRLPGILCPALAQGFTLVAKA